MHKCNIINLKFTNEEGVKERKLILYLVAQMQHNQSKIYGRRRGKRKKKREGEKRKKKNKKNNSFSHFLIKFAIAISLYSHSQQNSQEMIICLEDNVLISFPFSFCNNSICAVIIRKANKYQKSQFLNACWHIVMQ